MKLDYGTMISPDPLTLNIGSIKKPKLCDISKIGFTQYDFYKCLMYLTPDVYYGVYLKDTVTIWDKLSEDEKNSVSMFQTIQHEEALQEAFLGLLQFFFVEPIEYQSGFFVILNPDTDLSKPRTAENILGVITEELFSEVLNIIRQICGFESDEDKDDFTNLNNKKFKNEKARKLAERMQKDTLQKKQNVKANVDYSLPNVISKVCSRHPSINYTNVWNLTVYELVDSFDALRNNEIYEISKTRVSVWGDEKNAFKENGWYKNDFDHKDSE